MKLKKLRCKKSRAWVPNEYLTEVAGFCDKGFFQVTREFSFPCTFTPHQTLVVNIENLELTEGEYAVEQIRCGNCGGPVEVIEVDEDEILARVRTKEVDMNVALQKRAADEEKQRVTEARQRKAPPPSAPTA
ncbi:MAG: hypothetical protein L0216_07575 [Planctomycetales bacterium]|nr:hypothetical protein [Planctomycetales bacterium]